VCVFVGQALEFVDADERRCAGLAPRTREVAVL
jgi:hypothetical protein